VIWESPSRRNAQYKLSQYLETSKETEILEDLILKGKEKVNAE